MTKKELINDLFLLGFKLKDTVPSFPKGSNLWQHINPEAPEIINVSIAIYVKGNIKVSLQYYTQDYNEHISRYIGDVKLSGTKIAPFIDYDSMLRYVLKGIDND